MTEFFAGVGVLFLAAFVLLVVLSGLDIIW